MIPKIIHYCWLSGEPFPPNIENYINSWKSKFPDFEFKLWDKSAFDINSVPFVKQCLDFYNRQDFILPDGSLYNKIIAPDILAMNAEDFGLKFLDKEQNLSNNMHILPSWYFAGCEAEIKEGCYAIHHCAGSWREKEKFIKRVIKKYIRLLSHGSKF